MMSCGRARKLLLEHVRTTVGEASLLQLDLHLQSCEACRLERARVSTLSGLRSWEPPTLGAAARARIAQQLVARRGERTEPHLRVRRIPRMAWALGFAAAAAALALVWRGAIHRLTSARAVQTAASERRHWDAPGTLRFSGAQLNVGAGTTARLEPALRTLTLESGELDVTGSQGAPLRVATPRFVVLLERARVVFASDAVRVVDGEVYVYSLDERRLATLAAGQQWPTPPASPASPPSTTTINAAATPATTHAALAPSTAAMVLTVDAALDRARSALAEGHAAQARHFLREALASATSPRERAGAELFLAESYLVEGQPDRAVTAYRKVAADFPALPEADAAAFAAAQVLYERGQKTDARLALADYLARHPNGRFAREVKERLDELPATSP